MKIKGKDGHIMLMNRAAKSCGIYRGQLSGETHKGYGRGMAYIRSGAQQAVSD